MVNLASVLLARAAQREHEFAVSRALGANSAAIARATLFEGALLGLAGGASARSRRSGARARSSRSRRSTLPRREAIAVDWRIARRGHRRRRAARPARGRGAGDLGGARVAVVAAREQRRPRRRRSRPPAARHGRGAGGAVARAAQQRRARRPQLRAAASRRSRASSRTACSRVRVPMPAQFVPETRGRRRASGPDRGTRLPPSPASPA